VSGKVKMSGEELGLEEVAPAYAFYPAHAVVSTVR
jgi:hypothetical protein